MHIVYCLYQLFVAAPLILLATVLTSLVTVVGCLIGDAHFWGYHPGRLWSRFICHILLLPIRVEGGKDLDHTTSYIFVANHQGAFDIFLIYGYLGRNFKWIMKEELRRMPLIGVACKRAGHIFVSRRSGARSTEAMHQAVRTLRDGTSLVVFPEGSRTYTGEVGTFKKGAFRLADGLRLPIVPVTINGSFATLPCQRGLWFVKRHCLSLTFHAPIMPEGKGDDDIARLLTTSREAIVSSLQKTNK